MCAVTRIHIALPDAQAELSIYDIFLSELGRFSTLSILWKIRMLVFILIILESSELKVLVNVSLFFFSIWLLNLMSEAFFMVKQGMDNQSTQI